MYKYSDLKPSLFTEEGVTLFIQIRDQVKYLLEQAGAFTMEKAWRKASGDNWTMMACVDRMVEIGELVEVTKPPVAGQSRVFIKG